MTQASPGKFNRLPRTPAGSTALTLDGYGLRGSLPARPTRDASYPVSVRQVAVLLHASFRHHLAMMPLRFTKPSPPSGWLGDFHPQAVEHAGHTTNPLRGRARAVEVEIKNRSLRPRCMRLARQRELRSTNDQSDETVTDPIPSRFILQPARWIERTTEPIANRDCSNSLSRVICSFVLAIPRCNCPRVSHGIRFAV